MRVGWLHVRAAAGHAHPPTRPAHTRAACTPPRVACSPVVLSPKLSALLGGATLLPRAHVTKGLWAYIKNHQLQDATVKTTINLDAALEEVRSQQQPTAARAHPGAHGEARRPPALRRGWRMCPTPPSCVRLQRHAMPTLLQLFATKGSIKQTQLLKLVQPHLSKPAAAVAADAAPAAPALH